MAASPYSDPRRRSGKGVELGVRDISKLPLALPVTAQLQTTDTCWEATNTTAQTWPCCALSQRQVTEGRIRPATRRWSARASRQIGYTKGGIRPSPLAALGPARLPARRRSVGGKEILPFVEYRFGHARGPWHRVSVDCRYFGQTANPAPPDTTISCPVMYAAPSEARNATVSAMSSGL